MKYEDASDNNFPNDYDKSKVDSRIKLRTDKVDRSMWGDNVREAISQGVQIADVTANEAKDISNKANKTSSDVKKQFDAQIKGQNKDNESKDARISQADGKTYDTLKQRLDAMDKKPQQAVDNVEVGGVNLLTNSLPISSDSWGFSSGGTVDYKVVRGQYLEITRTGGSWHQISVHYENNPSSWFWDAQVGDKYVISFDVLMTKVPTTTTELSTHIRENIAPDNAQTNSSITGLTDLKSIIKEANTWYRLEVPQVIPNDWTNDISDVTSARFIIESRSGSDTDVLRFRHIKLEKGSKATDWTPAPQDNHHHQAFRKGTRFFAHRGAQSIAPENSLPAIDRAGNHAGVEIDIHTTSDGVWVVMHDGTVDRMTNGSGAVSSFTFEQIRKLRFDAGSKLNWYSDRDKIIPTLAEVLAHCKDHQLIPVVEIKVDSTDNYTATNYDSLANIINKFGLADEMMFISFNYQALVEIKKRLPLVEVSWLVNAITTDNITKAQQLGVNSGLDVNYTHSSVTEANIATCHNAGLKVGVWTLPNDDKRGAMTGYGADFITTNSLSGERRFSPLVFKNGWSNFDDNFNSCVQEVAPGIINLDFTMMGDKSGTTKKGDVFATIPDWAKPSSNHWNPCIVRDSNRAVYTSTFDIDGNNLLVGFRWENKNESRGWVSGNITYRI